MSITVIGITYDARDARRIAQFWGAVLGREVADGASPEHASLTAGDLAVSGPRFTFHQVPEGKTVKNRLHVDLRTADHDQELQRLLELGAAKIGEQTIGTLHWVTLADPEGNEFDLIRA